jgi:hypothetical protein
MVSMPAGGGAGSPGEKFEAVGFNFNMLENEENTEDKLEGGGWDESTRSVVGFGVNSWCWKKVSWGWLWKLSMFPGIGSKKFEVFSARGACSENNVVHASVK